jgi:hypothetical protein
LFSQDVERWKKRHADDKRAAAKTVGDLEARAQALQDQLAEGHAQVRPRRAARSRDPSSLVSVSAGPQRTYPRIAW